MYEVVTEIVCRKTLHMSIKNEPKLKGGDGLLKGQETGVGGCFCGQNDTDYAVATGGARKRRGQVRG